MFVTNGSRHQVSPVVGFKEVTDSSIQTVNCRFAPATMTRGELLDTVSSIAFQISFPVLLSSALTHAPGLAPVNKISRFPLINDVVSRHQFVSSCGGSIPGRSG